MTRITASRTLWTGLVVDAVGSGALGALHVAATSTVAAKVGAPGALVLGSGLFMLAYAAALAWMATRPTLPRWSVRIIVRGNSAWALGCVLLALLLPDLNAWAIAHLAFQAIAVTGFVALQGVGLARSTPARGRPGVGLSARRRSSASLAAPAASSGPMPRSGSDPA